MADQEFGAFAPPLGRADAEEGDDRGTGVSTTMAPATAASASRIGVRLMAISGSSSRQKNLARGRGFVAAKLLALPAAEKCARAS